MQILSIGKTFQHDSLNIVSIGLSELASQTNIDAYKYIIISGGDGSIRRVLKQIYNFKKQPMIILNPTGSFNVIAKLHRVPKVEEVLQKLAENKSINTQAQKIYKLNDEIFLFSAGNMGDLQHIFLSETLRDDARRNGMGRIGRAVAEKARAFGMKIHYYNRSRLDKDLEKDA